MAQANVYTTVSAQTWYTDKCRITTSSTPTAYQVNIVYPDAVGNLFSMAANIPANSSMDVYVGVGNQLTISGANFTAQEVGTASSAKVSVRQV